MAEAKPWARMVAKRLEENSEAKEKGRKVGVLTDFKEAAITAANTDTAQSGVPKEKEEVQTTWTEKQQHRE